MTLRIPSVASRTFGGVLLAVALVAAYSLLIDAGAGAQAASEAVAPISVHAERLAPADGPGHRFGFSQASVLAQASAATITKSDTPDPVTAGSTVTYSIPVANATNAAVTNVTVTDTLPAGLTLAAAPTTTTGTCAGSVGGTTVTCTIGTLGVGATATVTIVALVPSTTANASIVTNTATLTFTDPFNVTQTSTASASTTVTSVVTPTPTVGTGLTNQQALALAQGTPGFTRGQPGVPCAVFGAGFQGPGIPTVPGAIGPTCTVSGGVNGTGTVTGNMSWNLTATAPSPAGVAAGTPIAVFTTTIGNEFIACTAVAAGATTTTCIGTTAGNALQGSSVAVVFPGAGGVALGVVIGPGGFPGPFPPFPLLPPPPLEFLMPPPPPLLPPPPGPALLQPGAPVAAFPEVPVIPEADTMFLLAGGLAALGLVGAVRAVRRRRE